ncbi:MAG: hypothetical protein AAF773_00400 [Cyanobacteria bacterium P01_D01_bin.115]
MSTTFSQPFPNSSNEAFRAIAQGIRIVAIALRKTSCCQARATTNLTVSLFTFRGSTIIPRRYRGGAQS